MLLVLDVGNTNTKVGLCDDAGLRVSWTLTTRPGPEFHRFARLRSMESPHG